MIEEHWGYVQDHVRTAAFRRALADLVRPGDRVLDLGCGVGVLGALALEAGAAHVTAIDQTDIVLVARETFARMGAADRTQVLQGRADQLTLDAPVDLILCDHVGYFALDYGILGLLQDARARFLKPGGRILPQAVELFLAPVQSDEAWQMAHGWQEDRVPAPLHWIADYAVNRKHALTLRPEMLLGDPVRIDTIDFLTETRGFLSWTATLVARRKGWLHGLGGWFDCRLSPATRMTNSPLDAGRISRSNVFFGLRDSIAVQPGDEICVAMSARPDMDLFVWDVTHPRSGRRQKQSTWEGQVTRRADLGAMRPDAVPVLDRTATARQIVLGYCDGQRTLAQIEAAVLRDHPGLFPTAAAITDFVRACVFKAIR